MEVENKNMNYKSLSVGIIGGSISGCAMAIELSRLGFNVSIFEKKQDKDIIDRGSGICIPANLVQTLMDRDLVDTDSKFLQCNAIPRIWKTEKEERFGSIFWKQAGALAATNWAHLYKNLRKRVPEGVYHINQKVTSIKELPNSKVEVTLSDGERHLYDLLICSDGYLSLGRETLFPEATLNYSGYVLWRVNISEADLKVTEGLDPIEGVVAWPGFKGGLGVFYIIPGFDGSVEKGKRRLTCAFYQVVPPEELPTKLTDKYGNVRQGSISLGDLPDATVQYLKKFARENFPGYYADIICDASHSNFALQVIYDYNPPVHFKGRICLSGDAGSLSRPHAASGVLKCIFSAIKMAEKMKISPDLTLAIEKWNAEVSAEGERQFMIGKQTGEALILKGLDWSTMDAISMENLWKSIVTIKPCYT